MNPKMSIRDLHLALGKLIESQGDAIGKLPVTIWLPGSYIDLHQVMRVKDGELLIEGNLREGSALCDI
jgi:hypothetical protein